MEGIELKGCAFCNGRPEIKVGMPFHGYVRCPMHTAWLPVEDWQTRHPLQSGENWENQFDKKFPKLYQSLNTTEPCTGQVKIFIDALLKFGHSAQAGVGLDDDEVYQFMIDHFPELCPRNNETGKDLQMGIKAIRRGKKAIEFILAKLTQPQGKMEDIYAELCKTNPPGLYQCSCGNYYDSEVVSKFYRHLARAIHRRLNHENINKKSSI